MTNKYLELLSQKNFFFFFLGVFGFGLASSVFTISLNWWVFIETNSEVQLGLVNMFSLLPMFIFSIFSGVISDFFNRKKIIVLSMLIRGITVFIIPLFNYLQILSLWNVYILAFLQGISVSFFFNAGNAIIPYLTKQKNFMSANALIDSSNWAANLIGFYFGGLLIEFYGIMNLLILSAFVFLIASLVFLAIKYDSEKERGNTSIHTIFLDLKDGMKIIKSDKVIFCLIFTWMGIQTLFAIGPMSIGWPIFSERVLHAGSQGYGLMAAAVAFSSLIGSLIIGQWGSNLRKGKLIMIGYLWGAFGMIIFSFTTDLMFATLILFLWNFYFPLINITFFTLILERCPDKDLGKVFGALFAIYAGLNPISTLLTGYVMESISVTLPFLMLGISCFFCFLIIYFKKESRNLL